MNPQQLLDATERALGDSRLYDLHQELIALRQSVKEQEAERRRQGNTLEALQREQEAQRREYERFEQRDKLRKEAAVRQHKVQWLKAEAAQRERQEMKKLLEAAKVHADKHKQGKASNEAPLRALEQSLATVTRDRDRAKAAFNIASRAVVQAKDSMGDARGKLTTILEQLKELDATAQKQRVEVEGTQKALAKAQADLNKHPQTLPAELVQRDRELRAQQEQLAQQAQDVQGQQMECRRHQQELQEQLSRVQQELNKVNSVQHQMFLRCENVGGHRAEGLRKLHQWVKEATQAGKFKGPVYGPVALEVQLEQQGNKWVDYLETQIGGYLYHFITSCRHDEKLISEHIKANRWNIQVASYLGDFSRAVQHPSGEASHFREFGLSHTIDQVFRAPEMVKHALCDVASINRAYIGNEITKQKQDELFNNTGVRNVYVGSDHIMCQGSDYNASTRNVSYSSIKSARVLGGGAAVDDAKAQLEARQAELEGELHRVRQQLGMLDDQLRELQAQVNHRGNGIREIQERQKVLSAELQKLRMGVDQTVRKLQRLQQKPDPRLQEPKLQAEKATAVEQLVRLGEAAVLSMQRKWAASRDVMVAELTVKERDAQVATVKHLFSERKAAVQTAQENLRKAQAVFEDADTQSKAAVAHAQRVAPLTEELKLLLMPLASDIRQLETEAAAKLAQADAIHCNDDGVLMAYQARQARIADLTRMMEGLDGALTEARQEMERLREAWLPPLQALLEQINRRFSASFAEIGCAGEVSLQEHEDYDQYAIEIRVKFRESEGVHVLNANRQSGGERSVSTILYLIALQAVTETPFRVVDEINQGMDPINERKVFVLLVESSCKPDTPQCFLLTPKLLPGLPFTRDITVLLIQNGQSIDKGVIDTYDAGAGLYGEAWTQQLAAQQPRLATTGMPR